MFAYCGNNPVNRVDSDGTRPIVGMSTEHETKAERQLSFDYMNNLSKANRSNQYANIPNGGISVYKGKISICTDGSDRTRVPDSNWQKYTALSKWNTSTVTVLDAYTMPYVVMPMSNEKCYGAKLGDTAVVINRDTGQQIKCIIGEKGPSWGEVSIKVVWDIDNPNHMTANHASGLSENYEIIIYPGVSFGYDWSYGARSVER